MFSLDSLRIYLWITPHLLQAILLVLLVRRGFYKQFPIFVSYTAFEVLQFAVLFAMMHSRVVSGREYYGAFALCSAASASLRFAVIYEVFTHVFRNYPALKNLGKILFRCAFFLLLIVALVLARITPGHGADQLMATTYVLLDRSVSILQCGLLLFLFLFSGYFALSWRSYVFGIALGLGVYASMDLATSAVRSQIEPVGKNLIDGIMMGTDFACILIWMFYLLVPEQETPQPPKELPTHDMETWKQEIQRLVKRK